MTDDALILLADLLAARLRQDVRAAVAEATRDALAVQSPKPAAPLLDVYAVAKRLGCCEESVRRYQKTGQLRAVTSLGHLRFRPEDIEAFIAGSAE